MANGEKVSKALQCSRHRRRALALLLALTLATATPAMAGSRFYLTIEHSFADGDRPQIRLDYTDPKTPLVIRVLRPRDVDQFLDGQLNISRSYEEPLAAINPGHYLMRGLNYVDSPLSGLRTLIDPDFRTSLKSDVLQNALGLPSFDDVVTAPAEITQGPPAGFDVVREEFIDLQKGGESARSVYGWDTDEPFGNRYLVREISLDPLPDGLYLIQGVQNRAEAQALLQVSSLSMQVKQTSRHLVVRVVDRDRKPVASAAVAYRDGRGQWQRLGATSASGELVAGNEVAYDGRLLVRATSGDRAALTETDFLPSTNVAPSVFIVTDRPIFKPGESFYYKGTIRTRENGQLVVPATKTGAAAVQLLRQDGTPVGEPQTVALTDFGSFSGQFDLDPAEPPGLYRVAAAIDDRRFAGELRVRDYVKPTFYLELLARDPSIRPGETFHVAFRGKRYAGGVPQGVKYEVFVYRKKFEAPAWVAEAGAGLEAGHDYFGEVRTASALSEPQRLYSSVEARVASGVGDSSLPWASAPELDREGRASVEFTLPLVPEQEAERDWIYSVMVRAMDRAGSQAVLTENLYATQSKAAVAAQFDPNISDGREPLQLRLRSTYPDGSIAPDASGHVELTLESVSGAPMTSRIPFRTDAEGRAHLTIESPGQGGRLRAVAVLEGLGDDTFARPFTAKEVVAIVAAKEGEAVAANPELELHADHTILAPGEKARILAMMPAGWGEKDSGVLWRTTAGSDLFSTESLDASGRSRWFEVEAKPEYGTGFYQTITLPVGAGKYQEQTVGFRIVPADKRLAIRIAPERETAEPLRPFRVDFDVHDAADQPAANTELSINIVDRAVYAVQPEFRPGVLDYFYPLPRLSLGTFYSDELQGYGYAAELLRPNFRLSALKANVVPIKRDMRDTAGWFPHVVTDAYGHASVTAQMPANITEWQVTAIAIDRGGRAGEEKAMFRSARDVDVEPRLPPFLREGDVVDGHIELLNHKAEPATLDLRLAASQGASLAGQTEWSQIELAANGSTLLPARMTGAGDGGVAVLALVPASATARTGGATEVELPLRPATLQQVLNAAHRDGGLTFDVPAAATGGVLDVSVYSGLLGASLSAAATLVQYPFGCTEQLSHTTLPNLMLMTLVGRLDAKLLEPLHLAGSVEHARSNAKLGVQKLLANQRSDGGFGAWPGDSQANFDLTLIATRVLRVASELDIESARAAADRARDWLERTITRRQMGLNELVLLNQIGLTRETSEQSQVLVEHALQDERPSVSDLAATIQILRARRHDYVDYTFTNELSRATGLTIDTALAAAGQRLASSVTTVDWKPECKGFTDAGFCAGEAVMIASVYAALSETSALNGDLRQSLQEQLYQRLRAGWWGSTFDTAEVLYALRPVLASESVAPSESPPRVFVPGGDLRFELQPIPGGYTGELHLALPADVAHVEVEGMQEQQFATGILRAEVPFSAVKRTANGLSVHRTLLTSRDGSVVPVEPGKPLPVGTVVISQVVVERNRGVRSWWGADFSPSNFAVVEDGIPSIAEAIEDDRPYLADAGIQRDDETYWTQVRETQRHADHTARVVNLGPGATFTTYQVWRVGFAGSASLPPPRAYDMYDDSVAGNDAALTIAAE